MSKLEFASLTALLLTAPPPPLAGQSSSLELVGRADAFLTSGYYWRGIRRSAGPLFQLDGAGGMALGEVAVTGGIWMTLDPRPAGPERFSDLAPGVDALSEYDAWGQLSWQTRRVTLAGGVLRSQFARLGKDPRVTELFGQARLQVGRVSAALSGWGAVEGANGLYLEPAATFYHLVWPFAGPAVTWATTLRGGIQAGHRQEILSPPVPGPEGTGLTHVSLSSAVRIGIPVKQLAIVLSVAPELQYRRDAAVRRRPDGLPGKRLKFWLPTQLGVSFPLRRQGQ